MVFEDQDDLGTDSSGHPGQDGGWFESRDWSNITGKFLFSRNWTLDITMLLKRCH